MGCCSYYFSDKNDLIIQCIRQYKSVCVRRYDLATEHRNTGTVLLTPSIEKLTETLLQGRNQDCYPPLVRSSFAGVSLTTFFSQDAARKIDR